MRGKTWLAFLWVIWVIPASALRDPTRPAFYQEKSEVSQIQSHVLTAIITNHARRLARVDNHWVKEGQKMGDSQVVLIGINYVQLETSGGRINLFLPWDSIRKPVSISTQNKRQGSRK